MYCVNTIVVYTEIRLMYFPTFDASNGALTALEIVPLRAYKFTLINASDDDLHFTYQTLNREGKNLNTHFSITSNNTIKLDL